VSRLRRQAFAALVRNGQGCQQGRQSHLYLHDESPSLVEQHIHEWLFTQTLFEQDELTDNLDGDISAG
jgi:hypothetical protein